MVATDVLLTTHLRHLVIVIFYCRKWYGLFGIGGALRATSWHSS